MKYFLFILLFLAGCTAHTVQQYEPCKNDLDNCKLVSENGTLQRFHDQCKKLSECMGFEYELAHLSKQKSNPWACYLSKKGKKHNRNRFLYPKAELMFGEARSEALEEAILVCELMTATGEYSDKQIEAREAQWKKLLEDRARSIKENEEAKKPKLNPMKIREIQ
jgi:hypothetical protein